MINFNIFSFLKKSKKPTQCDIALSSIYLIIQIVLSYNEIDGIII